MYHIHPSIRLHELFKLKPYQGADPQTARFLFFGLDANYEEKLENKWYFTEVENYLIDGVAFWKSNGVHHPFMLPSYKGDGTLYHKQFAKIGFVPKNAPNVSIVELIDLPTFGRSNLKSSDLSQSHLQKLLEWVMDGQSQYVFIPIGVARLLRQTKVFNWLPEKAIDYDGSLPILHFSSSKTIFSNFHFSCVGKHCLKKHRDQQLKDIGGLI